MKKFDKIYVEITNICNLKCQFCIDTKRKKEFMNIEDFKVVIKKIKKYTNLIMLHIKGEPLMHPELKEILDVCFANGILVNITTNATLLEEKFDILAKSQAVRQLNISMHSISQNNLSIKESTEKIINQIKNIQEINENIIVSYRLWNIDDIKENDVNIEILNLIGKEYNISDILSRSKKEKFIKLEKNTYLNQDIEFKWPNMESEKISENGKCYGLKKQLGILVNGDIVPCCLDQNGDIKLGNIFKSDLEEILNSKKSQDIINGFNNNILIEELCKRCGFIKTRINK